LGYLNQNHAVFYYTDYLWKNGKKFELKGNKDGGKQQYTHDLFTDFAMDFIRRHKDEPFFLYVPYTIPHFNMEVPCIEPYTDRPWDEHKKIWAAMITRMDRDVGRILGLLKELDIDDNTIVFFCSDNGAADGSSGPLKGGKGGLSEGGIRTPMVVRWPGRIPAGRVSDAQWYFPDVMPTLAELAGVEPPDNIDGVSVLPSLLGKKQDELYERFMYWEDPPRPRIVQVVRWRDWKVMRRDKDKPLELYNLAEDIHEDHNIADQHPDIIAIFEKYLKTARTESPNWPDQ
ncbi:MAG: sulfatase-like hydrolase/transferase, partial [Planctomycetota bacterium]